MVETFLFAGIVFLVVAIAAAVFCFWVALVVVRGLFRLLTSAVAPRPPYRQIVVAPSLPQPRLVPVRMVCCGHIRCRAANPADAQFCRRCGKALRPDTVQARRPHAARGQLVA